METIFAILTVIVYILLALVGLVALTICVFLWMVSTPGKIQKYFRNVLTAGARRADRFAPKAGLSGLSFHPLPCGAIPVPGHRLSAKRPLRP